MILGIPKEIKAGETRVALLPDAVAVLVKAGHAVLVQRGAGVASGHPDSLYRRAGAKIVPTLGDIYRRAGLVVKVKEPLPQEYKFFRSDLILFCYLHLAANRHLARALLKAGVTALGFETLQDKNGKTPLLKPMSEIAGRLSAQLGAQFLRSDGSGKGILLSPTHDSPPGKVLVVGVGNVGRAAAEIAAGLGARVLALDRHLKPLRSWAKKFPNIHLQRFTTGALRRNIPKADLVIGAIYLAGARTPQLIRRDMVKSMARDSVLVDVAVDQGGAAETTRPTSILRPIYRKYGVIHCAIPNLPALVGRSASQALSSVILPYVRRAARLSDPSKIVVDAILRTALNTSGGKLLHPQVRRAFLTH
jgi:alanine dehydrogenase